MTETADYHLLYAINISMLDPMTVFVPGSEVGDGVAWIVVVRDPISKCELLNWFMNFSAGPTTEIEAIDVIPVRAFRVEPVAPLDGMMTVDGESVPFERFQGRVLPQKSKLYAAT